MNSQTLAFVASFDISYLAKSKTHHTIGETLLRPAYMKLCKTMDGEKYGEDLEKVHLSINTVM
jgi:hypothetical protein